MGISVAVAAAGSTALEHLRTLYFIFTFGNNYLNFFFIYHFLLCSISISDAVDNFGDLNDAAVIGDTKTGGTNEDGEKDLRETSGGMSGSTKRTGGTEENKTRRKCKKKGNTTRKIIKKSRKSSTNDEFDYNDDTPCSICTIRHNLPPSEEWFQCPKCGGWYHESCRPKNTKSRICYKCIN